MCGWLAVLCTACPSVALDHNIAASEVNHGLYADAHSVLDDRTCTAATIIGHLRRFVHFPSYTMTAHFADHTVAAVLTLCLDGVGDITDALSLATLLDTFVKRFLRGAA